MVWLAEDIWLQTYIMVSKIYISNSTIRNSSVQNGGKYLVGTISHNYKGPEPKDDDYEWSDARDMESYGLDFTALEPR